MTKQCELCDMPAQMYCDSDQASLCWKCDGKVHGANFLVARHTRSLLCRSCQAPTPWRASGPRLGPTESVCERCLGAGAQSGEREMQKEEAGGRGGGIGGGGHRIEAEAEDIGDLAVDDEDDDEEEKDENEDEDEDEDDEEVDEDEDEDEEDGDNQVVPWSTDADGAAATPPPMASSSSSDESSSGRMAISDVFLRRMRENGNPSTSHWQDGLGLGCTPAQPGYLRPSSPSSAAAAHSGHMLEEHEAEATSVGLAFRHRKRLAQPAGPVPSANRPRSDRLQRGTSGTVDFSLPSSPSPPI